MQNEGNSNAPPDVIRAAQYLRKSTAHQEYSTALQSAANHAYAASKGIQIVRTYADEGKSGLSVSGRAALQQLLDDVQSGRADFTAILVYDVSRWGRFQDIDESGYHEHICKRAGVRVHYCSEQFANDESPLSAIVKNIKRVMAGEFSRELSAKTFAGHARLVPYGYSQGGPASYGLRRLLLARDGTAKLALQRGDRKNVQTERVVWVPGAPEEVEAVRWIFETFVRDRRGEPELARTLNRRGARTANERTWTSKAVRRVLCNERYVGNYSWNRISTRLRSPAVRNAPGTWIRAEGVIQPIVSRSLFDAAQEIIRECKRTVTLEQKLQPLRRLLRARGRITCALIRQTPGMPSVGSYYRWFGGLIAAYRLVGFTECRPYPPRTRPPRSKSSVTARLSDDQLLDLLREVLKKQGFLNRRVIDSAEGIPHSATYVKRFGSMKRAYRLAGFLGNPQLCYGKRSPEARRAATKVLSNAQMLNAARRLLRKHGKLTRKTIDASGESPSSTTYLDRFGSMERVYRLIGYRPGARQQSCIRTRELSNEQMLELLRKLMLVRGRITSTMIDQSAGLPSADTYRRRFGSLAHACALIHHQGSTRIG
jgi:DNA invertase Pin-like site-specific DNA recombinase